MNNYRQKLIFSKKTNLEKISQIQLLKEELLQQLSGGGTDGSHDEPGDPGGPLTRN